MVTLGPDRRHIRNELEVVSRENAMTKLRLNRICENGMLAGWILVSIVAVSIASTALANKSEKAKLPELVVKAQSVAVLILPGTRESISDPTGNRKAQEDVEKAFMKWGRYQLTQEAFTADLVIGVRKARETWPARRSVARHPTRVLRRSKQPTTQYASERRKAARRVIPSREMLREQAERPQPACRAEAPRMHLKCSLAGMVMAQAAPPYGSTEK